MLKKNSFAGMSFSHGKFECYLNRSTHPEFFFNEIWSIYQKVFFLEKLFWIFLEILRRTSGVELIFRLVMSFQYVPCCRWFCRNFQKISEQLFPRTPLSGCFRFSLKISRIPFNPLTAGGSKRSYISKQTSN